MKNLPPICTTVVECNNRDNERIAVVGTYRYYPDLPDFDYSDVPRVIRIELEDGLGPFLDPYWSEKAIRAQAEIKKYLGTRVCVIGHYHKDMPVDPDNPPEASAMGGACIEVELIKLSE